MLQITGTCAVVWFSPPCRQKFTETFLSAGCSRALGGGFSTIETLVSQSFRMNPPRKLTRALAAGCVPPRGHIALTPMYVNAERTRKHSAVVEVPPRTRLKKYDHLLTGGKGEKNNRHFCVWPVGTVTKSAVGPPGQPLVW